MEQTYVDTCTERSRLARSFANSRCATGLRTDSMPGLREYNAKCGEVVVYRYNLPHLWAEYKLWDDQHRREYIEVLSRRYSISTLMLAEMLGVSRPTVDKEIARLAVNLRGRGKFLTDEQKLAWQQFLARTESDPVDDPTLEIKEEPMTDSSKAFQFEIKINSGTIKAQGKTQQLMRDALEYLSANAPETVKLTVTWEKA